MLKQLWSFLGFVEDAEVAVTYPDTFNFRDNLDLKIQYLKDLESQENDRQNTIETKTAQLIGQTGIIFSLLGLFIPTYIDKFENVVAIYKFFSMLAFLMTLLFYLLTIFHATKYLNVNRYKYGQRSTGTVKKRFKDQDSFKVEEIKDLIFCIEKAVKINTLKAGNLIYAYRSFKIGNFLIGILSLLLLFSFYSKREQKQEIQRVIIEKPIHVRELDSLVNIDENKGGTPQSDKRKPVLDSLRRSTSRAK